MFDAMLQWEWIFDVIIWSWDPGGVEVSQWAFTTSKEYNQWCHSLIIWIQHSGLVNVLALFLTIY